MTNQVLEIVVYQIKSEYIDEYRRFHLPKFKRLVSSFDGMLSYDTMVSCNEMATHVDLVKWKDLASALKAAEMVKTIQQSDEFSGYLKAFEKVVLFHHFSSVTYS
ncbi:MAG: hypothetical protein OQJ89_15235 [Kangiellaceae bacterium]|nr:hypothetical protein [Kangiellaceae bacterium]MCW8999162.1 hypothetical protein [Kangiellaceae bacterium]MCW9018324.1 hypothetical protein [Kangiellaceae bacterium]